MTSANLVISLTMLSVRISVLALYHRLFGVYQSSKRLIRVGYILSVLIALPEIGNVIARMLKCSTILAAMTDSYCRTRSISIAVTVFAITGVITDVFIYSIPIMRLRTLRVNRNKKIQLAVIFALGLIALVFSFSNLIFVALQFHTKDQLWYAVWVALFK